MPANRLIGCKNSELLAFQSLRQALVRLLTRLAGIQGNTQVSRNKFRLTQRNRQNRLKNLIGWCRLPDDSRGEVTQLLQDWQEGNQEALRALAPLVYQELRRIAH